MAVGSSRSLPISSPPSTSVPVGSNGGHNYILHHVSKFDTLAGVAIKYGVEVADIKRQNGLVTDLQMFALKTIQIPLPGRHPPSPSLSNGHDIPHRPSSSDKSPYSNGHSDLLCSFQSLKLKSSSERKVSPAMSSLQGYYGLRLTDQKATAEGIEMTLSKGGAHYLEDVSFAESSPLSNPPLSHHRKSKSVANGFVTEKSSLIDRLLSQDDEDSDSGNWMVKLVKGGLKSGADFTSRTPEKLLKEENNSGSAISVVTGKGLALRPKSASRTVSGGVDAEACGPNSILSGLGDSMFSDNDSGVRKSSSTSSLDDSDTSALSSIWTASKWSLKPDFHALSNAVIARPIFDGLPKPMGRKNKAALD
ncbi:hypothetical protein F511_16416 [Dorcoceras hygrometricum]|uniref:LysM domain-containing protein n=1 Tax=Dorcoceras hygrometricum TaxID=472368 RepID=A0A2Z7CQK6_9LAMI|nr:hypothetical protein F511_16416 [Dorcoceras hygrometricum]